MLEQRLTLNPGLRDSFMAGLQQQLSNLSTLHAALKPMQVTGVSTGSRPAQAVALCQRVHVEY